MVAQLRQLPAKVEEILSDTEKIQYYASIYFNHDSVFYIGRNIDYAVGLEGSLKLKEISYIHSEAYAAGGAEARHHLPHRGRHPGGGPGQLGGTCLTS